MPPDDLAEALTRVQKVAAGTFGCAPEAIGATTVAADVEKWDSLRHLIFISGIEQEFDIEFDMDAIAKMTNVADLLKLIAASRG